MSMINEQECQFIINELYERACDSVDMPDGHRAVDCTLTKLERIRLYVETLEGYEDDYRELVERL